MISNNEPKSSKLIDIIQVLLLILLLSLIATPSNSQSSDFLNRSEEEIRQEHQRELDEKFNRTMDSAIERVREADRLLDNQPTADEEIFLIRECQAGISSACDYLREIEQDR